MAVAIKAGRPTQANSSQHDDRLIAALSIGIRRRMLRLLSAADGTMCVFELVRHFDVRQSTISHHLKILTKANLVYCDEVGVLTYYYVNHDVLDQAMDIIGNIGTRRSYASH